MPGVKGSTVLYILFKDVLYLETLYDDVLNLENLCKDVLHKVHIKI